MAEHVEFSWRSRRVLCDVDLTLTPGTVTALRGVNGSGKTTLIKLLGGGLEPDAGHVRLGRFDAVADRRDYLRRVGLAGAGDRGIYARLDVRANLQLAAALALVPRRRHGPLIGAALQRFGLSELAGRRADRLSLGQRQRVRLAIAFLPEPDVVLLDEPASSLDAGGTELLVAALSRLAARGAAALWAAPDGSAADLPADRTCALAGGRLERIG